LSLAFNNAIDLDDEDLIPIENNNIAENLSPIPSNSSFENYSRASFSQHAQLRKTANQHVTQNLILVVRTILFVLFIVVVFAGYMQKSLSFIEPLFFRWFLDCVM
ncbi:384_t:CDS:2, partial [Racocetra fulgida]